MNLSPVNGWWYPHDGDAIVGVYEGIGVATIGGSGYSEEIPAFLLRVAGFGLVPIVYDGASWTYREKPPHIGEEVGVYFTGYSKIPTLDGWIWRPVFEVSNL